MYKVMKVVVITIVVVSSFYGVMTGWDKLTTDKVITQADAMGTVRTVEGYAQYDRCSEQTIISTTEGQRYTIIDDTIVDDVVCWIADNNTPTDYTDDVVVEVIQQRL